MPQTAGVQTIGILEQQTGKGEDGDVGCCWQGRTLAGESAARMALSSMCLGSGS